MCNTMLGAGQFWQESDEDISLSQLGVEAVLMAVPVGKWAIQQGFRAALGFAAGVQAGNKSLQRRKDREIAEKDD